MEEVHFDKITSRIRKLSYGLNAQYIDPVAITQKVGLAVTSHHRLCCR